MSQSYLEIQLEQQPIELCKLLKIADLVTGGGEAKVVISEGYVLLNGEVEYQKRKKVYHNDIVEFNGEVIQVVINEELSIEDHNDNNDSLLEKTSSHAFDSDSSDVGEAAKYEKPNDRNIALKKAVPDLDGTARQHKRKPISF